MNTKLITGSALAGLVMAGGLAGLVSAQTVSTETGLTEDQIIAIALAEVDGEVQETELEERRGTSFWEVEIVAADGTEMEVEIDAATGDVLKVSADDDGCDKDDRDDDDDEDEGDEA